MRDDREIRDLCCFKSCRLESDLVFYGAGLCDAHYAQACIVYRHTAEYLIPRVLPEAALLIREQHQRNLLELEIENGQTESDE